MQADATVLRYKREYIIWLLSLILSLFFYLLIADIISKFYHPDIGQRTKLIKDICIHQGSRIRPEPLEQALVITGLIILPLSLIIIYHTLNRALRTINHKLLNVLYPVAVLCGTYSLITLIYQALTSREGEGCFPATNLQFYFHLSLPYTKPYLYSFIIFPSILFSFLLWQRQRNSVFKRATALISRGFIYTFSSLLVLTIFLWNVFPITSLKYSWHFNAVFYPSTQIYLGKALLIDGFTHTYGLFAHFLNPIFDLFGLCVLTFSIVMSFLLALSFLFIFLILRNILENKSIIFLGFTTMLFLGYLFGKLETGDYYFQYHPIRFFPPCLIAFLALWYIKSKNRILYYSTFIFSSVAIMWNFDAGIVVYLSWILFLCYRELSPSTLDAKEVSKNILTHISVALLTVFGTVALYLLLVRIGYGKFPSLNSFIAMQLLFSKMGFNALPMPRTHPWNIVILMYIVGLLHSIYSVMHKKVTRKTAMVFFFTLIGFGTFAYYQGRSHNWNLFNVWSPFFILATIFADDLLEVIKRHGIKIYHCTILFSLLIYMLSFSFIDILVNSKRMYSLFITRNRWYADLKDDQTMKNINFIRTHAQKGEEILILSSNQAVYFSESGTLSAFNPSLFDLFYKADYERLLEVIKNRDFLKIFVEPADTVISLGPDITIPLSMYYQERDSNGSMQLFQKAR